MTKHNSQSLAYAELNSHIHLCDLQSSLVMTSFIITIRPKNEICKLNKLISSFLYVCTYDMDL